MISWSQTASFNDLRWADFKSALTAKNLTVLMQYETSSDGAYYLVWVPDGGTYVLRTNVFINAQQDIDVNYTRAQANADQADFETNYKASSNGALVPRSEDGRALTVHTITKNTKNFQLRCFSFQTANAPSLHNASPTAPMTDTSYTCYDVNGGNVTSSPSTAVVTVLDLVPTYAYECIGGWMDTPDPTHAAIVSAGAGLWYISAIGVPDIPASYGGSIPFVHEVDIALVPSGQQRIESDASAVSYLKPSPYFTNKLRWTIKHPVGAQQWFQVFVRIFV